jgi:hypothetical protein
LGGILLKRLFSCIVALIIILASLPLAASAQEGETYVWVLKEVTEYNKSIEVEDYNKRNADAYDLSISVSKSSFTFSLKYIGKTKALDENGRHRTFKEGDSASSTVVFGDAPRIIKPEELISLSVELRMISDNTYDKAYDFLPTKASAFFDKAGARPDIPTSGAVYFAEKEGEKKGTAIGTKTGLSNNVSTTLSVQAPNGNDEKRVALCVCAESILTVGTKYVYELVNEKDVDVSNTEQVALRKASVREITGSVTNGEKNALKNDDTIPAGTTIKTEAASGCELSFDDKSFVKISENSELLVDKAEVKDTVLKLISGKAWAYIQPIVYGGSFTVKLKYADLKIKGTIFAVEEGQDFSVVWLFTGSASIVSVKTEELTEIQAGQKAVINKDGDLTLEYFTVSENIGQWGIPSSAIREDSGYAWVKYFIIGLAVFTVAAFTVIFLSSYLKKKKKLKFISGTTPEEGQCQFCGTRLEPGDTFCKMCGAAVKKSKDPEQTS